jgi:hypothetical protein
LSALPNRTPADDSVIQDLLTVLRGGAEHAQQRGTLMAFIAQCQTRYTRLHGIQGMLLFQSYPVSQVKAFGCYLDPTRLSNQSRTIDLGKYNLYDLVLQFCIAMWPDAGIFGPGMVQQRYLSPVGMVRNYSYMEHDGIRYGAYKHASGIGYCYGYIDDRYPVRINHVLRIAFPGEPDMHCVCVLVRRFQPPRVEARFPWDEWYVLSLFKQ